MKWYVGADHAGYPLKELLAARLAELGDEVVDLGTMNGEESVDYPEFGARVGKMVAADPGSFGLLCCGTGIGISIAANKVRGIRAAAVSEPFSARMAREHNDANVLCLGARVVGPGLAREIVEAFRTAYFEGGRHQRRVDQINVLDEER